MASLNQLIAIVLFVISSHSNVQSQNDQESGELLLVQVIFRHGDRTPLFFFDDNDPYKDYDFPEGLGGFTRKGKELLYKYGSKLRVRYSQYLENVPTKNIIAQSSPTRRVMESSLSVLAGLFKPTSDQIWSNTSDTPLAEQWQPVQVATVSFDKSYVVGEGGPCPEADKMSALTDDLPEVKQLWADNQELVQKINQYSGLNFTTWGSIAGAYDTLYCEQDYFGDNFQQPEWINQVGDDTMERMQVFRDMGFAVYGLLPQRFLRLKAGPFLKEMSQNLKDIASQEDSQPNRQKVFTYGTHDTVLSMILNALDYFTEQPRYGSGVIFELRRDPQTQAAMVHLFYANVTNDFDIYPLALNQSKTFKQQCPNISCPLEGFIASLLPYIPDDIEVECGAVQTPNNRIDSVHSLTLSMVITLIARYLIY